MLRKLKASNPKLLVAISTPIAQAAKNMIKDIPVVYADHWLPPFSSPSDPNRVIDWSKCGLFIPEYKLRHTVDMLRDMSDEVICEMQKCSLAFWDEFASSRVGWLRGILRWVNSDPDIIV